MKKKLLFLCLALLAICTAALASETEGTFTLTSSYGEAVDKVFNDTFTVRAEFENSADRAVTMYSALYSDDGSLISLFAQSGSGTILSSEITISDNSTEGAYLKLFVFDNELTPMLPCAEYKGLYTSSGTLDDAVGASIIQLNTLLDDDLMKWFASLYDPETGGFYYSESARDYDGFLPDLESTWQAISFMQYSGLVREDSKADFPEEVQDKLVAFASSLYDSDDGYFYHPQWGKDISDSRRERDKSWARGIITKFDGTYPPVSAEPAQASLMALAESDNIFESMDSFKAYLDNLPAKHENNWYAINNELSASGTTIDENSTAQCDFRAETQQWLIANQDDDGLWGNTYDTNAVNAAMKASRYFLYSDCPYPEIDTMFKSVMDIHKANRPETASALWNPVVLMLNAKGSYSSLNSETEKLLSDNLPSFLNRIYKDALKFRRSDGGYSYRQSKSQSTSQGALVSMGLVEGDVNSSILCSVNLIRDANALAGRANPKPLEGKKDVFFADMLDNVIYKKSVFTLSFDEAHDINIFELAYLDESCSFDIADNPSDSSDKVLCISDSNESGKVVAQLPFVLKSDKYSSLVWSYDFYLDSADGGNIYETNLGAESLAVNIVIDARASAPVIYYRTDGVGMGNEIYTAGFDKWYTLSITYTPSGEAELSIAPKGETPEVYPIEHYGTSISSNIKYISFSTWTAQTGKIYINDVSLNWEK